MSTDGHRPARALEVVTSVDDAATRVLDYCEEHGGEPMLCTHDEVLDEPALERIAMLVRWVSMATYDRASPHWLGGPVLAVDLDDAELAMVGRDPRAAAVILARRHPGRDHANLPRLDH